MRKAATEKDDLILAALLAQPTIRSAAAVCGVSPDTVYKRLNNAAFKAKYDAARREIVTQTAAYLQGQLYKSLEVMAEIRDDKEAAQQVRLNAANALVQNTARLTEQADVLAQIEELKKAVFPE